TTLNSVPYLFLLLIISAMLRPTVGSLILILAILSWTGTMRFVRGETLSQREREYVVGARAIGANAPRIMLVHILPNIFSVIVINLATDIGAFILIESALSFLNLGVRPPTPSWGNMLTNAQTFFTKGMHLVVFPGMAIVITVLCLFLIGDGMRDAFDPQAAKKNA
ncbi:MAG TPA: ABC transporter permease, partial [Aggregatilineaceae bacterium]|nr:ABC transporter permease [Aggregatilineaceae bacterium]